MSVLFKIGNTDYTNIVVNATYKINEDEINETYEDCNHVTHYLFKRTKVSGTFDVGFKTYADYVAFVSMIQSTKSALTNSWSCMVTPNNNPTAKTINARITFKPTRELTAARTDIIRQMTVNVEEL